MKLTKKAKIEVTKVYDIWLHSYLNGDVKTYDSYLDKDYRFIGSTDNEEFLNRKDTTKFLAKTADQLAGKTDIRNNVRTIDSLDGIVFITDLFDAYFLIGKDWTYYGRFRFTSALSNKKAGWRFIYQHFSMPDAKAKEGETLGAEQISKENQELRDAIKRRTVELEQKNRDLEIEAGLERVRSRAMAMQNSDELSELVDTLLQELTKLDFSLTACIINIIDGDDKSNTVWVTNPETGKDPESYYLKFEDYKFHHGMWKAWKARKNSWVYTIKGAEKETYQDYLFNKTEFKRFSKNAQEGFLALEKWVASFTFSNFGGLQTIGDKPLSEESLAILARFGKVFDLTYTRFNDLKQAEAQAREARVEAALERIRSQVTAMKASADLLDIVVTMRKEFVNLGHEAHYFWHMRWLTDTYEKAMTSGDGTKIGFVMKLPRHIHGEISLLSKWEKGKKPTVVYAMDAKAAIAYVDKMITLGDFQNIDPKAPTNDDIRHIGGLTFIMARTSHGEIGYSLPGVVKNPPTEDLDILVRFATAFDLAHKRFEDLKAAESQYREAQIELALERVRSRSLAMHKSEELEEVIQIVYKQFAQLNINAEHAGFAVDYEVGEEWNYWVADPNFTSKVTVPHFDSVWSTQLINALKKGDDFYVTQLDFKQKNKFYRDLLKLVPSATKKARDFYLNCPGLAASTVIQEDILLYIENFLGTPYSDEENNILKRFGKVFQQAYTRFLDLQKAETQAREAQIETSLERVRAASMAMHHSTDLQSVISIVLEQFEKLDIPVHAAFIYDQMEDTKAAHFWTAAKGETYLKQTHIPRIKHPFFEKFYKAIKNGTSFYTLNLTKAEKNLIFRHYFTKSSHLDVPLERQEFIFSGPGLVNSTVLFDNTALAVQRYNKDIFTDEENEIIKRIGFVFEQTYTRFLDLQKAESQAKEAQIEAALERVRSKTMAMHNSQDVGGTVATLFDELVKLDVDKSVRCGIGIMNDTGLMELWAASSNKGGDVGLIVGSLDMTLHPLLVGVKKAWQKKKKSFSYELEGDDLLTYYKNINNSPNYPIQLDMDTLPEKIFHNSFSFPEGVLFSFSHNPIPDTVVQVFIRFAKVFSLTYRRFLDLQKAEEQARKATIEASLERVRSKTMAMHNSKDVGETVVTLFNEVLNLGLDKSIRCGIGILKGNEGMKTWSANILSNGEVKLRTGMLDMTIHPLLVALKKAWKKTWKKGESDFTSKLEGDDVARYYKALNKDPGYPFNAKIGALPENEFHKSFFFSEGILFTFAPNPISEEAITVLKKFTAVFEQTYTRFLDLKKAEEQTRTAQINLTVERVRAKAMAMHSSKDLIITANQLFQEFQYLEISFIRCGVLKIKEDKTAEVYSYSHTKDNKAVAVFGNLRLIGHELMDGVFSHWKLQKEYVHKMKGEEVKRYYQLINKQVKIPKLQQEKTHFGYAFYFPEGCLYCFTNEIFSEDTLRILRKFNTVMGLTYRRYFELQEAEARELTAIKESSLDRVRAEIASMQTADDLNRITPLVWKELNTLGVPFFRCGVFIVDQEMQKVHAYLSTPSGESLAALELEFDSLPLVKGVLKNWKKQEVYIEKWNKEQFIEFAQPLLEQGQINSSKKYQGGLDAPEKLVLQMVPFKQGMLYVGSKNSLTHDQIATVESLAKAFSVAYTRYEDFKELEAAKRRAEDTLTELKSTQTQLIQSEKMASLGELTAGIAHEIQNPLNFVNNFSELSEEMLEELEDEIKDNSDKVVIEIMTDLKQNLNKITNHGKRASNIVKGMLDHSRTGSGISELTDINKLADEYLRLSYHGLRAKDKTFNADFKSDLDDTIPKIEIVAQDIGRVILNLINNAFYACTERSRRTSNKDYKPKVTVSTKKIGNTIEVQVKDNGSGIPEDIKDKIFQPFFTTKPTGSGTGLGLSLAYDIITKGHGGELKVDSKEGEFTKFTIVLPY